MAVLYTYFGFEVDWLSTTDLKTWYQNDLAGKRINVRYIIHVKCYARKLDVCTETLTKSPLYFGLEKTLFLDLRQRKNYFSLTWCTLLSNPGYCAFKDRGSSYFPPSKGRPDYMWGRQMESARAGEGVGCGCAWHGFHTTRWEQARFKNFRMSKGRIAFMCIWSGLEIQSTNF